MSISSDFTFTADSLMSRMGMQVVEWSAERTELLMPVAGNTQPAGLLHGGASAALAETAGSMAAQAHAQALCEADGVSRQAVGTDLSIRHVRSVATGLVRAVASAVHLGRSRCVHQVEIFSDDGKLVSTAQIGNQLVPLR